MRNCRPSSEALGITGTALFKGGVEGREQGTGTPAGSQLGGTVGVVKKTAAEEALRRPSLTQTERLLVALERFSTTFTEKKLQGGRLQLIHQSVPQICAFILKGGEDKKARLGRWERE